MRLRDKVIVFFSFLFIAALSIGLSFANRTTKENSQEKRNMYKTISGDFGTWETTSYMTSDSQNIAIDGNNITYYRNDDPLEDNEVELHFNTSITENKIDVVNASTVIYYVNTSSLFFYDDSYENYVLDAENNMVKFNDEEGNLKGYIKLGSDMPFCDYDAVDYDMTLCSGNADYYWFYNNWGLMITNGKDITNLDSYSVDLKVTYALDSDFYLISEQLEIINSFEYMDYGDSFEDYDPITSTVTDLVDNIDLSGIHSEEEIEYTSWQSEWGNAGADYDYYVLYSAGGIIDYALNYNYEFEINYDNGDVVAYSPNGIVYYQGNNEDFINSGICNGGMTGEYEFGCYVVVGYNVGSQDIDANFKMDVSVSTDYESQDLSFSWVHQLSATGSQNDPVYPDGISKNITQTNMALTAGEGSINKINGGSNVRFSWLMESSNSNITNGYKAFNLWNAKDGDSYTVSISSDKTEIDENYSAVSNPEILSNNEYNIVSFYPQDDVEYEYVLSGNNYVFSPVVDYGTYSEKEVYVSISGGDYELIGTYVNSGNVISYVAKDGRTSNNNNVSDSNPVELPSNVTKIKVTYTGDKAGVYLGININVELKGSDSLKNILDGMGDTVVLKNVAAVQVNNDNLEYDRIGTYLTELEVESHITSTSVVNERIDDGKTDLISYTDTFYEELGYSDNSQEALAVLTEQKNGVIYELLPAGAELSGNVTVKTIGNNAVCTSSSENTDNYNGTGRTLVKVSIGNCETNYYDTGSSVRSGYVITFNVTYGTLANQSYGTTLLKDVMVVSSSELGDGYSSPLDAPDSLFSENSVKNTFDSLVNGNNNLMFVSTETEVESLSVSVGTYSKEVKNSLDTSYSSQANVVESGQYTYKLQYAFTSDLEEITNVVFIDKLEDDYGSNNHFNGYLTDVDISNLTSMGVDAKVYYAVGNVNIDLFDITQWSETKPDDITSLKAIAVVCGSYVFKKSNNSAPTVYVNMTAPNEYSENIKAYNKSKIIYKNVGNTDLKSLESEVTEINLNKAQLEIDGVSNFGKGTQSNPAIIDGDLSYEISVENKDSVNGFDNVVVEVSIPEGLRVLNLTAENNVLTYNIDHIDPSETKNFTINVELNEPPSGDKVYKAGYKIVGLNGNDYSSTEGYIYNKVDLPAIEAHKYAKTSDTNSFSDLAGLLVKKDEEFSYRIAIENTSNKNANDVVVVDTVPEGLIVVESSLGEGVRNGNEITWTVDVARNSTLNIDYKVKLDSNAVLGTVYRSNAHVTLVNPLLATDLLYDEDTNVISVLYQIASSVKVTNTLNGNLADANKEFEYTIEFNGSSANAGKYDVYDTNNNSLAALNLDENGVGSYSFKLKGNQNITFKNLTGGIDYTIKQSKYTGYASIVNVNQSNQGNYVVTSGSTSEEGTVAYTFTNSYSAQGDASIAAKVTYDKDMTDNMFKISIGGTEKSLPASGSNSASLTKHYNNEVGQFTYVIKQINTDLPKISYDSKEYKAVVNVTNNGAGLLNTQVKYYDNNDKEVEEVVFNNTYLPNGLTIKNVNNSEYVDQEKLFSYEITLTNGEGTYEVKDGKGNRLTDIEFVNGEATYSVNLLSNESILISDLPDGVDYVIKQGLVEYYKSTSNEEYDIDDDTISVRGTTIEGSKEIQFDNRYDTEASFKPSIMVKLEGKDIEENEFSFKLLDVSNGSTNGYTINAKNNAEGLVEFEEIKFTKPGTYKYEIVQLDNGSNHVYFDFSKVFLVLELTDNGDGTMEVLGSYEYENAAEYLLNKYSVEPVVKEEIKEDTKKNPNTNDRVRNILILLITVLILFGVERWVRYRRYSMDV